MRFEDFPYLSEIADFVVRYHKSRILYQKAKMKYK